MTMRDAKSGLEKVQVAIEALNRLNDGSIRELEEYSVGDPIQYRKFADISSEPWRGGIVIDVSGIKRTRHIKVDFGESVEDVLIYDCRKV